MKPHGAWAAVVVLAVCGCHREIRPERRIPLAVVDADTIRIAGYADGTILSSTTTPGILLRKGADEQQLSELVERCSRQFLQHGKPARIQQRKFSLHDDFKLTLYLRGHPDTATIDIENYMRPPDGARSDRDASSAGLRATIPRELLDLVDFLFQEAGRGEPVPAAVRLAFYYHAENQPSAKVDCMFPAPINQRAIEALSTMDDPMLLLSGEEAARAVPILKRCPLMRFQSEGFYPSAWTVVARSVFPSQELWEPSVTGN